MSMYYEIEFMDGVKKIIDSRGVMQYKFYPTENRVSPDGWGCCMEYFIASLAHGKPIVYVEDWSNECHEEVAEVIHTANIRTIKSVNKRGKDEN